LITQGLELTHVAHRSRSRSPPDPTICNNFYKSLISSNTIISVQKQLNSHLFRNKSFPLLTSSSNGCRTKSSPTSLRNTNSHFSGNFCLSQSFRKPKKTLNLVVFRVVSLIMVAFVVGNMIRLSTYCLRHDTLSSPNNKLPSYGIKNDFHQMIPNSSMTYPTMMILFSILTMSPCVMFK